MALAQRQDRELVAAQERITRWRKGGPALFAVEALGMPPKWDPVEKTGVVSWWYEASEKLVRKQRLSMRSGHGVGKSSFLSIAILWFTTLLLPLQDSLHGADRAPVLRRAVGGTLQVASGAARADAGAGAQFEQTQDEYRLIEAPKESFAVARTARADKPEALQGFHSENLLIVADEASGIPDVIFEVGQGTLSTEGAFALLAANPTRKQRLFLRNAPPAARSVGDDGRQRQNSSSSASSSSTTSPTSTAPTRTSTACACSASSRARTTTS
jgi:hypothetical protein